MLCHYFPPPPRHFEKLHVQMPGSSLYEVKCYVPNTNTRKTHSKVAMSTPRVWGLHLGSRYNSRTQGVTLGVTSNAEELLRSVELQKPGSNTMVTPKPQELPGGAHRRSTFSVNGTCLIKYPKKTMEIRAGGLSATFHKAPP